MADPVPAAGTSLRRLLTTYRDSLLLANAGAIDYSRDVISQGEGGHGKHGTTTTIQSHHGEPPFCIVMETALARFAEVWAERLATAQTGASATAAKGDRRSAVRRAEKAAILAAVGQSAIEVGWLYGWTEDGVRRARLANGLDPDTGERVHRERPVTADARTQLQQHESATTTTTETDQ